MALTTIRETAGGGVEASELPTLQAEIETILSEHPDKVPEAIRILREALDATPEDTKDGLQRLIADLESNETTGEVEYSMEYLRDNSEGFLSKLLEIEIVPGIDAMKAFMLTQSTKHIGAELLSIMPDSAVNNFQILTWNKAVESIGISSVLRYGASSFFSGFSNILGGAREGVENAAGSGLSVETFTEIADSIQNFNAEDPDTNGVITIPEELALLNGGNTEIQVPSGIAKGFDYLESITSSYFQNMKALLELGKSKGVETSTDFQNLIAHPAIMQEVLENGKYNENGIEIDIQNGTLQLAPVSEEDIKQAGNQIMQEILGNTNSLSGKIDGILAQTDKFVTLFEKLGIDPAAIKETLFNIPVIGFIFKILFGDFLDTIQSKMASLNEAPEVKKAMENFGTYIEDSENSENLPFTLREEDPGKLNDDEVKVLRNFIKKLKNNIPGETEEEKEAKIQEILNDPKLAEKLLTGEGITETDTFLKQVHEAIQGMFSSGSKPTQEEFFQKLDDIEISIEEASLEVDPTDAGVITGGVAPTVVAESGVAPRIPGDHHPESIIVTDSEVVAVPEDNVVTARIPGDHHPEIVDRDVVEVEPETPIPSLETQVAAISAFPAAVQMEDGSEVSISYDSANKTITLGENSFTLTEINREGVNLIGDAFNLENLAYTNSEGTLSIKPTTTGSLLARVAGLEINPEGNIDISIPNQDMQAMILGLIREERFSTMKEDIEIVVA